MTSESFHGDASSVSQRGSSANVGGPKTVQGRGPRASGQPAPQRDAARVTRPIPINDDVSIGGTRVAVIAGPCAVESLDQTLTVARAVQEAGACLLRGGIFKLRTSPNAFQGVEETGFAIVEEARRETGMGFITEAIDERTLEMIDEFAEMIQIGTRNMHNYALLKRAGKCRKPVLLKRGFAASIEEFLLAAEYILSAGNPNVILCERGIRTFCTYSRYTLDLNIVPALKERTELPIVVDPSHGTGKRSMVGPMALAAIACGADGVMIEVHNDPDRALSDGQQSLTISDFEALAPRMRAVAQAVGRDL